MDRKLYGSFAIAGPADMAGVGFHNQGHFIRFLLYVDLATSYHLLMLCYRVWDYSYAYNGRAPDPSMTDMLSLIFNFAACVPVWIAVGCFSLYHLYLAAGNSTTIEGWEKDKVATLVRRGKIREVKYPYVGPTHGPRMAEQLTGAEYRTVEQPQVCTWAKSMAVDVASANAGRRPFLPR